jgi:hypothetical protein
VFHGFAPDQASEGAGRPADRIVAGGAQLVMARDGDEGDEYGNENRSVPIPKHLQNVFRNPVSLHFDFPG